MSLESNIRVRPVGDPLALRALAHPVRRQLHGLVARAGSLTAADAARQLGISQALASHHLRQLAKYGFVEPAQATDSRAHPWRVTATSMSFEPSDPQAWAPNDLLQRYAVERAAADLTDWQARRAGEDPRWAELAGVMDSLVYLEPHELEQILAAWIAAVRPLVDARPVGYPERRPAGAAPVSLTLVAVPVPRTEQGG